ncbi:hypothetical protein LCGC14_2596100 [marine sediment metagenome]|uniref:Uncharacterized protein n=1 Tax=marine sediment metagenome TaxID=412755 RepID=A0A0F9AA45_9ZZZZ
MVRNEPVLEKEEEHNPSTDLYADIRRLDSIIRRLTRRMKKLDSDEMIAKFAHTIGLLTSRKCDLVCIVLDVEAIVKGQKGLAYRK